MKFVPGAERSTRIRSAFPRFVCPLSLLGIWLIHLLSAREIIEAFCHLPATVSRRLERVAVRSFTGIPVATTPPPVIPTATSEPVWTECFLMGKRMQKDQEGLEALEAGQPTTRSDVEVWLFRSDTVSGFEKFLQHRHFDPANEDATCRSISPDSSIQCLECIRIIFGGVYGSIGIIVPTYPPESQAVGCLSRNRVVEADFDDDDNYDGNPTREVALCNSHRGRLDSAVLQSWQDGDSWRRSDWKWQCSRFFEHFRTYFNI